MPFVSRAGAKLQHALSQFRIEVRDAICADLGSNVGGFADCLLQAGAARVYCIDTGYGVLDWKLRKDPRVVVMERTNAMHAVLPDAVGLVTIDVAWTRQRNILPAARRMLGKDGKIVTLIKPHYEADKRWLRGGVLMADRVEEVLEQVRRDIAAAGLKLHGITRSPILGNKGNAEFLAYLTA
ncbi:MAG TPA: SAM-dependent methyltransferase [Tepidisphaeraceae bacterium]|nr:SAM-dependent methyltransferase [Tepidisphaeraceae bacterium]